MQMRKPIARQPDDADRESFGELLGQLANNSAALVRDEITLAKKEMSEKLKSFRSGLILTSVGAVIGLFAILTLIAAAVIALADVVGPTYSALIIGGVLAVLGGVIALVGIGQIKRTSLKPEQTMETLEEDKEWLKELT